MVRLSKSAFADEATDQIIVEPEKTEYWEEPGNPNIWAEFTHSVEYEGISLVIPTLFLRETTATTMIQIPEEQVGIG